MLRKTILFYALSFSAITAAPYTAPADGLSTPVPVFEAGESNIPYFRIPVIERSNKGTLLAFAEARYLDDDHARNDIVLKRSKDGGKTWGKLQTIHADQDLVMVNPSPVTLSSGRILLMYETFPHGFHARNGKHKHVSYKMMNEGFGGNTQKLLMRASDDDGKSWSKPIELQKFSRQGASIIQSGSPANGIQLKRGKHKGRILFPLFLTEKLSDKKRTWKNAVLYSDDEGRNWKLSKTVPIKNTEPSNECLIAETDDGHVVMNARAGRNQHRAISHSVDGGMTWSAFEYSKDLIHRPCNAGLLKFSYASEGDSRTFFSYNNSTKQRANGYLAMSPDDGKTWPHKTSIVPGYFGYSQLVKIDPNNIGVIYEPFESPRQEWSIYFLPVSLDQIK
ncbi:sialidase [Oceaniferula spumae]|uniref:exo-alpha-sialidase n=1 Tax=Oceaniferula spumae TaxID=2979115 RepID=A0AAT9FRF6_9BACT